MRKLIRGDLDWIVMKAIDKDRTRRYETANELVADIERHLNDEPVSAGPPSAGYRLHKFVRRHRAAVITVALVTGATLMGATAVKFAVWMSDGSAGMAQHAAGMVQRHVWDRAGGIKVSVAGYRPTAGICPILIGLQVIWPFGT